MGQLDAVHPVPDGVTLHWHGMDVPNADDGVAGVTQDAVLPGKEFTYRFVARDAGTYWYHSHQVANLQVQGGLFGSLVVTPRGAPAVPETTALVHHYGSNRTVDGRTGDTAVAAAPGSRMRVRVVNTDNGPMSAWVTGAGFRLVAIDGTDVHDPGTVSGRAVTVTAGGRADLDDVAFVADNPGVWMDHCHNLEHAAEGLVAHLLYTGVTTPYRVGGDAGNDPE